MKRAWSHRSQAKRKERFTFFYHLLSNLHLKSNMYCVLTSGFLCNGYTFWQYNVKIVIFTLKKKCFSFRWLIGVSISFLHILLHFLCAWKLPCKHTHTRARQIFFFVFVHEINNFVLYFLPSPFHLLWIFDKIKVKMWYFHHSTAKTSQIRRLTNRNLIIISCE